MKALKKLKIEQVVLVVVAVLFLGYLINSYSNMKGSSGSETMSTRKTQKMYDAASGAESGKVEPSQPLGQNETYASAKGMATSTQGLPPSCAREPVSDPSELLPKDANSEFAQLNPSGSGDLQNVNLLKAGYHMGINTVGNSLRNANLQLRSEPANPQVNVGPWNNTTISPDTMRVPLEIGQGPQ